MAKLSKAEIKTHEQCVALLQKDALSMDDRWFVLEHWNESANHINSAAGAFFTPEALASDFVIEVGNGSVIDLCAGIGRLAFHVARQYDREQMPRIVCVEKNPDYLAVGRKVVPEAEWICADVFSNLTHLGRFDTAISNPPFGNIKSDRNGWKYKGCFDLGVVEVASTLANYGAFILPRNSVPFGEKDGHTQPNLFCQNYDSFHSATGIELTPSCISAEYHAEDWKGVSPKVEIALASFDRNPLML